MDRKQKKKAPWMRRAAVLSLFFGLAGCAVSPISKEVKKDLAPGVTFSDVLSRPEAHVGQKVLWAGEILDLRNAPDGSYLEILQSPADSSDAPTAPEDSEGRFIAFTGKYLDRAVYKAGRKVTVVGTVKGKKEQSLGQGQSDYAYPLLEIERLYLWPKPARREPLPFYDYADPFYYPWGDPWDPRWRDFYWDPVWHRWMPRW